MRSSFLLVSAFALIVSCAKPGRPSQVVVVSPGSGPAIASTPDAFPRLSSRSQGPQEFLDLRGVLSAPDGSVAAADAGVPAVYLFDPAGNLTTSIGRSGSGPGEFREPTLVAFWGDSLAVFDPTQRRLTYFRRDGSVIRVRQASVPGTFGAVLLGIRRDGTFIYKGTAIGPTWASEAATALVLAIDLADRIDTLAVVADGPWLSNGPLWYAWRSAAAVTDSGIWYGSGGRPELRFKRWDGGEGPAFRWDGHTRAVNDQDRDVIATIAGARRAAPALTAGDRFADSLPYFARLLSDPAGGVWVIGSAPPFAAPDSAWVVDPTARTIHGVALPAGFRPTQVGSGFLLGVSVEASGANKVVRYGLTGRSGGSSATETPSPASMP